MALGYTVMSRIQGSLFPQKMPIHTPTQNSAYNFQKSMDPLKAIFFKPLFKDLHKREFCRKVQRLAHGTNLEGYGRKLCQQEFQGKPYSLGVGCASEVSADIVSLAI